jgi:glycosyltransferase involved in cell wall biosynthesis
MRVFVNGKFAAQPTTGVQRVATQLLLALDALAEELPGQWTLLCPPGAQPPPLKRIACREVGAAGRPLHLWEQWTLPRAAKAGLLLNLSGSAPWAARRQACLIHDAAVFDQPAAYSWLFRTWYRALFRHLARSEARLFTVSAFSRLRLTRALGVAPSRIAVVPNAADHVGRTPTDRSVLQRLGLEPQKFLLAVGSDNPAKNQALLVRAYASWQRQSGAQTAVRLVLVGGRNPKVFAGQAGQVDPPGVLRTGPLPDPELKALYGAATALVFPSRYEGFGLPPLEAMSLGCPVVVARAAAMPEVCGSAALYVEPDDEAALALALERVVTNPAERHRLQDAGPHQAARYAWATSAQQLLDQLASGARA